MHDNQRLRRAVRTRLPIILLAAGGLLTLAAAAEAYRTSKSNSDVESRVLRDYSAFVAWSYANIVEELLLATARDVVGPVEHGGQLHSSPQIPTAQDLVHLTPFDESCGCHRPTAGPIPETFFAFEIRSDNLETAVNTHPDPREGWEVDRPLQIPVGPGHFMGYSAVERDSILRTLRQTIHRSSRSGGFDYLILNLDRGPRALLFTTMPTTWGDTMVYGAQYTPRAFAGELASLMESSNLLPAPLRAGRRNSDVVDIAVYHPQQGKIFESGSPEVSPYAATAALAPGFASLTVQAAIRADQAATLVVGGLPRSRVPFLVGLLLLSALLTAVAVMQLRRESELARHRAEWVASVSHELRTPLAQIRLFLDTVRLGRAPTEERRNWALSQVDRETTRLGHMVEKVLSFSRLEQARSEKLQSEDPALRIREIVDEFRPLAEARGATIQTHFDSSQRITLRRDGLRHIVLNLLDNAVKYGPEGQTILVELRTGAGELRLSVADQGPGVDAAERDLIWRPFARGQRMQAQGGSGIGLVIVREIAAEAGGRTWVEDAGGTPNSGARFVVVFPVDRATA